MKFKSVSSIVYEILLSTDDAADDDDADGTRAMSIALLDLFLASQKHAHMG